MKVYEIMNILDSLPSGADVSVHGLLTVPELRSGCHIDVDDNNEDVYAVDAQVCDIESNHMKVILYF